MRRRIHGVVVETDVDLPVPAARPGPAPFLRVRAIGEADAGRGRALRPRTILRGPGGAPWLTLARDGERLHLRFPGIGRFVLSRRGRDVGHAAESGVDPDAFRRALLDHVLPRALGAAGLPVLHGSAVAGRRGALVFLGESGAGKSSLAALLAARGRALLADDAVRLEAGDGEVRAHPSHPLLRLREPLLRRLPRRLRERAEPGPGQPPKRTLDARRAPLRFAAGARPAAHLLLLTPVRGGGFEVDPRPVPAREAALALLGAAFRADPWDLRAFSRDLEVLASVASGVPVHRLRVPRTRVLPSESIVDCLCDL